jgi:holo-[acyl-carrier protein] synthase
MIMGIGNDIIEVSRIARAMERQGDAFVNQIFTPKEQDYCRRYAESKRHFAGRFAAKEAIVKALGCGFRHGLSWLDIEIENDSLGKPVVVFSEKVSALFGEITCLVSISHCHEYATAMAIVSEGQ